MGKRIAKYRAMRRVALQQFEDLTQEKDTLAERVVRSEEDDSVVVNGEKNNVEAGVVTEAQNVGKAVAEESGNKAAKYKAVRDEEDIFEDAVEEVGTAAVKCEDGLAVDNEEDIFEGAIEEGNTEKDAGTEPVVRNIEKDTEAELVACNEDGSSIVDNEDAAVALNVVGKNP